MEMVEDISSVMVYPLSGFNNLKAMASLNYRGVILRGLKLMEKDDSLWLGMPSRKRGERWEDIYFFPDADMRRKILDAIAEKYTSELPN
jgi:DNA-binding cell septation regulator SpoVG